MTSLKDLLSTAGATPGLSTPQETQDACDLIMQVQSWGSGERDCIRASFTKGPLFDGDVPSKSSRTLLVSTGFMSKVVVKGEEGYNACTYKGATAYRLLQVIQNG